MRVSALFGWTSRQAPADAELPSHQLLLRAGMIRRVAAGVYTYLPLGLRVLRRVEGIIRQEMEPAGYQELLLPILQPRELWEAGGRWQSIGAELFRLRDRVGRDFSIAFTNEELISQTVAGEVHSYRQLPVRVYHLQRKFRDEPRPRGGLIRLREFMMKDAYSFDGDQAALEASYARMLEAYQAIFARCELEVIVAAADSGVMGGSVSHELLVESPNGENEVVRCAGCGYAANVEAAVAAPAEAGQNCARCGAPLRVVRAIELGHLFQLGTRYSATYGAHYLDEQGRERALLECSYGIGLDRALAAIAERHHDERGLCWPRAVAPFDVYLCTLSPDRPGVRAAAEVLERELEAAGQAVLYDDREESAGVKFADADLLGLPLRVTVSPRTLQRGDAELKRRSTARSELVSLDAAAARSAALLG